MNKLLPLLLLVLAVLPVRAQLNASLLSNFDFGVNVNDVWGYVSPDGTEYALVGLDTGVAIVNLADPTQPELVGVTRGVRSTWRDMKTYGEYAYAVTDQPRTEEGLTVIDLRSLPESFAVQYITDTVPGTLRPFYRAHNLYIDTLRGLAFTSGGDGNVNAGGMLIWDLKEDPWHPKVVAKGPATYSHDVYVQDDIMYASEIYIGELALYDVSDIDNITQIGRTKTPFEFTHNAWANASGDYVFTTDELADASVAAFDISDPASIELVDEYRPLGSLNTKTFPHNVHVIDDYLSISYYTDGLRVVDASVPDNLVEIANYDTWLGENGGYNGDWGAYPFLPSGNTLVSDRATGLYVVSVDYRRAARLMGTITDSVSGSPINLASIEILTEQPNATSTDALGAYATGIAEGAEYRVAIAADGYRPDTLTATLTNGEITTLDVALVDTAFVTTSVAFPRADDVRTALYPNPAHGASRLDYTLRGIPAAKLEIYSAAGALIESRILASATGSIRVGEQLAPGMYLLHLTENGRPLRTIKYVRF